MKIAIHKNDALAEAAFTKQSSVFDEIYAKNTIVSYKRERVRNHTLQYLVPDSNILELNSGTGEDAIFFAEEGHRVYATDIATGMQQELKQKVTAKGLDDRIGHELCSYTMLHRLQNRGPYDHIFSNFAGLNCTAELGKVLDSFNSLLVPSGKVTLVILPKFCLWEFLLLFKGKFRTAFRRLLSGNGSKAHIDGAYFKCWYYNPSFIVKRLKNQFDLLSIEGLCTIVPPSYIEGFAEKHPITYRVLRDTENKLKSHRPWKYIGDYYIISLQKKA